MELWSIFVGLVFSMIIILSLLFLADLGKSNKLPPGPTPLPIIGNLHILGTKPHQSLAKLAQIYGPIMSVKLGGVTTIVISSSSTAKQVLQKQDLAFSTRSVPNALHAHNHYQYSLAWLPVGTTWRSLRKIVTTVIFSSKSLDANHSLRTRKVQELVAICAASCKVAEAVDIGRATFLTSLSLMSNTIFSKDILSDPYQGSEFKELMGNIMSEASKTNLADYFPVLRTIDPQNIRRRLTVHFGKILELFGGLINERMDFRKLHETAGIGDLLDLCLDIREENPEDLFIAGTDTASITLEWAMAEVLSNAEIMGKAKAELDEVIGKGKILEEAHISQLPYLQSILKETLRLHPPLPFLLPRKVVSDAELDGYFIPKDSQVLVNAWAIGRDHYIWDDALTFKPERFLNSDCDVRGLHFELIPFGAGRRICPGLPLAMRMILVMLGSLINLFDWKLDGGIEPAELDMSDKFGLSLHKAHPLRAIPLVLCQ